MTIGQRVKQRRKELGLTQEELAKRLGNSSRASICTVEKDREDLTTTRIAKLANALETSPAFLMGWVDNPDPLYVDTSAGMIEKFSHMPLEKVKAYDVADIRMKVEFPTGNTNDIFFDRLPPEDKENIIRLYKLYQKADPAHRLAVESLLRDSQQESEHRET